MGAFDLRKLSYHASLIIIITGIWIILHENLGVLTILSGIVIGTLSIAFTDYYLLLGDYKSSYHIPYLLMLKYLLYLLMQIYVSGILSIIRMLQGKTNVGIISFKTELENELYVCLLANAITLTPGTVTLDKSGQWLKVLCLHYSDEEEDGEAVKSKFEEILMGR